MYVFDHFGSAFNEINLCTCWNQLGKQRMSRRERADFFYSHERELLALRERTEAIVPRLTPRNLAGLPYGIARLGFRPAHRTMRLVAVEAVGRIGDFTSQELANIALAFATAGVHEEPLFDAVAAESCARIADFNAQELANTAWAFAKVGRRDAELFAAIEKEAEPRLDEFIAQGFANTAWAFATAGVPAEGLFDALARRAIPRMHEFKPQELANMAWAFATAGFASRALFHAIAHEAFPRVAEFTSQGLANLVWAFAKAGVPAEGLFGAVAREAAGGATVGGGHRPSRLRQFTTQELANTAFAFARADVADERLSAAIASESLARIAHFNEQELANTAWAFATAGMPRADLFNAIAAAIAGQVQSLSNQGLTHTVLAFAKAGWPMRDAHALRQALAAEVAARADELPASDLANMAWSFAVSNWLAPGFAEVVFRRAAELGNWAFTPEERSAMHQFMLSVRLERLAGPDCQVPSDLAAECAEAMQLQAPLHSSQLHLDVSAQLRRLAVPHVNELCVPELGYHVDIAIVPDDQGRLPVGPAADALQGLRAAGSQGLIIEVNGPSHYDVNRRTRPESAMKVRHLELSGWRVVEVPWWDWSVMRDSRVKQQYLLRLLRQAGTAGATAGGDGDGAASEQTQGVCASDVVIDDLEERVRGISAHRARLLRDHLRGRDPHALSPEDWRCPGVGDRLAQRIHAHLKRQREEGAA